MSTRESALGSATLHLENADDAIDRAKAVAADQAPFQLALAQVEATMAVAIQLRALTDMVGQTLGDDSHLDGLKQAVRDLSNYLPDAVERSIGAGLHAARSGR